MDIKGFILDFVSGKTEPQDFIDTLETTPEIYDWLQSVVPEGMTCWKHQKVVVDGKISYESSEIPYDVRVVLNHYLGEGTHTKWGTYLNIHASISRLLQQAFPNETIEVSSAIEDRFVFGITAVPDYIGGNEVNGVIDEIIDALPSDMSKTKRVKLCKEKLREVFHIEGSKYPRWIQSAEWPAGSNGMPMKFVEQKRRKDKGLDTLLYTEYLFEDVETGERRTVAQFT